MGRFETGGLIEAADRESAMKTALAIAATLSTGILLAHAQSDAEKLGTVNFETSCNPAAQKLFNQAMLYQHSFWYRASQNVF